MKISSRFFKLFNFFFTFCFRDHFSDAEDDALQISPTKVYCLRCPKGNSHENKDEPIQLEKIPDGSIGKIQIY